MNQRLIVTCYVPLVLILNHATCRRLSLLERDGFLDGGMRHKTCVCAEPGCGCREKKGRERWRKTRRDKDRNERFEPRNKNKQLLNPRQQWNSQLGSGLCFIPWRTFSGQASSAALADFSQHPYVTQPASI